MKFYAQIGENTLTFRSVMARVKFFEHKGKDVVMEIDDKPTSNMRRFFEGAVVPYTFYQHPDSGWETFRDAREALKVEFLPSYVKTIKGDKIKTARSTTGLSKARFTKFLETVLQWLEENGYEVPDSEDYKNWRDSAPGVGEVYPPLARIAEQYRRNH